MSLLRPLIHRYLYLPYWFGKITRSGPFGPGGARPAPPPAAGANRLKAALFRHYVHQFNEAACSVATVATVVNALREVQAIAGPPVTQQELLETVATAHWKQRMHGDGYQGRRGLPLALLGQVVQDSLEACGIRYRSVETVAAADPATAAARNAGAALRSRLHRFETRGDALLIAHFDQGALLPTLNIPHISPVGGFELRSAMVTILDVDSDQTPYQVPFQRFQRAIASNYHHAFRPFGYGRGGYVHLRLV